MGSLTPITGRTFVSTYKLPEAPKPQARRKTYPNPLFIAQDWERRLVNNQALNRADLAPQFGVTRSHVTQVLRMLSLDPKVKEIVLALGDPIEGRIIGAHTPRTLPLLPPEE